MCELLSSFQCSHFCYTSCPRLLCIRTCGWKYLMHRQLFCPFHGVKINCAGKAFQLDMFVLMFRMLRQLGLSYRNTPLLLYCLCLASGSMLLWSTSSWSKEAQTAEIFLCKKPWFAWYELEELKWIEFWYMGCWHLANTISRVYLNNSVMFV